MWSLFPAAFPREQDVLSLMEPRTVDLVRINKYDFLEGRKEGRKDGRKEGRKGGKGGREEGRKKREKITHMI